MTSLSVQSGAWHPLTDAESAHIDTFRAARPDWNTFILAQRMFDEDSIGCREHKYPRPHPYVTGMQQVMLRIRDLAPCSVLDIGSPIGQNIALACLPGVDVTVLDVRPQEDAQMLGLRWEKATATEMPFPDASWSVITSLWVMGHVGDGRYGDAFAADGDLKMLAEISRILRPGGTAILGPGLIDTVCGNIFNLHRVYTWAWLEEAFARAGLQIVEKMDLPVENDIFFVPRADGGHTVARRNGNYGLAILRKT
jgi:SAM-dependent methyltransferase